MSLTKKEKSELKIGQSIRFEVFESGEKILSGRGKVVNKINQVPGADGGRLFLIGQYTGDKKIYEVSVDYFGEESVIINRTRFPKQLSAEMDNYITKYFKEQIQTEKVLSDYRTNKSQPKENSRQEVSKRLSKIQKNLNKFFEDSMGKTKKSKNILRKIRYEIDYDVQKNYVSILLESDDSVDTGNLLESKTMWDKLGKGTQTGDEPESEQKDSVLKVFEVLGYKFPETDKKVNDKISDFAQITTRFSFMTDGDYMMPKVKVLLRPKRELEYHDYQVLTRALLNY